MMNAAIQRSIACLLVFCVLAVGGLASARSLTHESQHAHHQKATHGTVLCSWMCAAGQVGEGTTVPAPIRLIQLESLEVVSFDQTPMIFSRELATRGPPAR